MCHYLSDGPLCPKSDQQQLLRILVDRAEGGSKQAMGMLSLTPCDLYPLIKGRTLWLMGDSIMQEYMRAVSCFFIEFWPEDLATVPIDHLPEDKQILDKMGGGWCVELLREGTRICHIRGNMGDEMVQITLPAMRHLGAKHSDILVINTGVWVNDAPGYAKFVGMLADYLHLHAATLPVVVWRDSSSQHFDNPTGDFGCVPEKGCWAPQHSYPFVCQAIANVSLDAAGAVHAHGPDQEILTRGGWRNEIANPIMASYSIPVMHTWNQSLELWQFHHHYQAGNDCTHSCHPGPYQLWIYDLYKVLQDLHAHPDGMPALEPSITGTADT